MIRISSNFDGGNIRCISAEDPSNIQLEISNDNNSDVYQWFYFRITGALDQDCILNIVNGGGVAYPDGFEDYQAVASYDREQWFRVDTVFDGKVLSIHHMPECNSMYFAYFAPYSDERHADLICTALASPNVDLVPIGTSLDGHELDVLCIGAVEDDEDDEDEDNDKMVAWIIGRQHPGETMAEWWMEGFLGKLLDEDDPISRELLNRFVFFVVPNMNPDGSRRGHLRMNAAGANLNREWMEPSMERSPEVFQVRELMLQTGMDFSLDVHGDEGLPYNFIAGSEGIPSWNKAHQKQLDAYKDALVTMSPDFQTEFGYDIPKPGEAVMTKATNYFSETFGCLAMTLEMPFKDTTDTPNENEGWSPERCRKLAEANLMALYMVRDKLR